MMSDAPERIWLEPLYEEDGSAVWDDWNALVVYLENVPDPTVHQYVRADLILEESGDWVLYSDHHAENVSLRAEVERLTADVEQLKAALKETGG